MPPRSESVIGRITHTVMSKAEKKQVRKQLIASKDNLDKNLPLEEEILPEER